jgi:hypothetical protein
MPRPSRIHTLLNALHQHQCDLRNIRDLLYAWCIHPELIELAPTEMQAIMAAREQLQTLYAPSIMALLAHSVKTQNLPAINLLRTFDPVGILNSSSYRGAVQ